MICLILCQFYPFTEICNDDENFKQDLVDRINEMRHDEFDPVRIGNRIDELYERIHDQMILDRMRYYNCSEEEAERSFDDAVKQLKDFFVNRGEYLDRYEEKFLNGE